MAEVPNASGYHGNVVLVGGGDGFVVTDRSAGLDDGGDAGSGGSFYGVGEGEESIRGHDRAPRALARALRRDPDAVHAVGLSAADADRRDETVGRLSTSKDNGVRFDVPDRLPSKP